MRPYYIFLIIGLGALIAAEGVLVRLRIVRTRGSDEAVGLSHKYDRRFMDALDVVRRAASATAFRYTPSATLREMVRHLATRFPDQATMLNSVLSSMEGHVYGGITIDEKDFRNFSRLNTLTIAPRIPRGLPKI